jgi:putative membrane protein
MIPLGLFNIVRGTAIFLVILFVSRQWTLLLFFIMTGVLLPMIGLVFRFFSLRYQFQEGQIRIHEGIFSKRIRTIPVRRIHNINTSQSPVARLFKVMRLDLETAGGGAAEASFIALSYPAAQELREFVRREKSKDDEHTDVEVERDASENAIYQVRIRDLLIAGATTNRMGVILVAIGIFFQYAEDFAGDSGPQWLQWIMNKAEELQNESILNLILLATGAFLTVFILAWLISIASAILRWFRFTLSHQGDDLKIRAGLITIREQTVPREKIQALRFKITPFRRPFKLTEIRVQTAGRMGMQDQRRMETNLLVPITRVDNTDLFVKAALPHADWDGVTWRAVHPYTRTRHFFAMARIVAGILFLLAVLPNVIPFDIYPGNTIMLAIPAVTLPLAFLIAHLTYKQTGYATDDEFVYVKTGFIGLHFWVIPIGRIQNLALSQTPFQRWRQLASLHLDVAGPAMSNAPIIPNIPINEAWLLFNRLGHTWPLDEDPGLVVESPA